MSYNAYPGLVGTSPVFIHTLPAVQMDISAKHRTFCHVNLSVIHAKSVCYFDINKQSTFGGLTLLVELERQEGHLACKNFCFKTPSDIS